jgi:hypothetical protein
VEVREATTHVGGDRSPKYDLERRIAQAEIKNIGQVPFLKNINECGRVEAICGWDGNGEDGGWRGETGPTKKLGEDGRIFLEMLVRFRKFGARGRRDNPPTLEGGNASHLGPGFHGFESWNWKAILE